jgi:sugar phosphate isomerase/epimerase
MLKGSETVEAVTNAAEWFLGCSISLNAWNEGRIHIEDYRNAGVRWIELAWRNETFDLFDRSNQEKCEGWIRKIRSLGMDVWTLHLPYGPLYDVSEIDQEKNQRIITRHVRFMELAHQWQIDKVVLHPSYEPIKEKERAERMAVCRNALIKLAAEAERLGIAIAAECLPRTCLGNTSAEMQKLISADDRLGICCDVNHLFQEPPEQFIRKLGPRIISLHVSDNDGVDERHWMPGRGVIQWKEVIDALAEQRYEGPFMFEVAQADPAELERCWKKLLASKQ